MRDDIVRQIAANIDALVGDWRERVEYGVAQPSGHVEIRVRRIRQASLFGQLQDAATAMRSGGQSEVRSPNPSESQPPGNLSALFLIDSVFEEAETLYSELQYALQDPCCPNSGGLHQLVELCASAGSGHRKVREIYRASDGWVHRARVYLGYDKPDVRLRDIICRECGCPVMANVANGVAEVHCTSYACGRVYTRHEWLTLLVSS